MSQGRDVADWLHARNESIIARVIIHFVGEVLQRWVAELDGEDRRLHNPNSFNSRLATFRTTNSRLFARSSLEEVTQSK